MRRGEVWRYAPVLPDGTPAPRRTTVVVVSDPAVITSPYRWLHVVPFAADDPGHVLTIHTCHGWADALEFHRVYRVWLAELAGELSAEEMDALDTRLRAALSL
ncbi:mRNA-degrading endonuclease toxin of MazEF toxin-antitoxin module [Nocardia transvalensis]|uniref:mRNA-degrading endonuclease toxin of MazEF toxin-antitoxin module n=1 Tax=Nocardia transvalensis TaxID=37333 RepID=A0A7W9PL34_9NOCA|nr:hypothetical protein [Nocardia transvalensis]MBB5917609.1 mRNA-degrading endonuclease toxin of MazEF toxin-antitoxin module [Nocardia transvalensis]